MNTFQLEQILSQDPLTSPVFGGVYPSDGLPTSLPPGKRLFIANTDPAHKPGEHWVAFYFTPGGVCTYFDSYGLPPFIPSFNRFIARNADTWKHNPRRLQHLTSQLCGHYCIFFGVQMCRGMNLNNILRLFDVDTRFNDIMMRDFVEHYYGHYLQKKSEDNSQSCCGALKARPLMY